MGYELNEKQKRMIEDDSFFDVSAQEVKSLLVRMSHFYSREAIIKMRVKYDAWIDDAEKRTMQEYGLRYDTHRITKDTAHVGRGISLAQRSSIYINGYSLSEWRMLTDETYIPGTWSVYKRFLTRCEQLNDVDALEVLHLKYQTFVKEHDHKLMEKNGIRSDLAYTEVGWCRIDGISFFHWKLLHDDTFCPKSRAILVSAIHRLRKTGYEADADIIEEKYHDFLHPDPYIKFTEEDYIAADEFFKQFIHSNDDEKPKM